MNVSHSTFSIRPLLLCLGTVLASGIGLAADAYVAKWGSDASDGLSWAMAKLTVNAALGVATTAGNTIYVGTGTYSGAGNVDLSWSARNGVNLIGTGPTKTTFVLTGTQRLITGLENKTIAPLLASFKIDGSAKDDGFDGSASLLYADNAIPLNLVFSNLWLVGRYDGDQVNNVKGTAEKQNGTGIELNWYGNAAYTGYVTMTHCLFERLGRAFYADDDNGGFSCYTARFVRCTFVNNADTRNNAYGDRATVFMRGATAGRWMFFDKCVMSHTAQDSLSASGYGIYYNPNVTTRVFCNDDLFYTNTIGRGADNCYGPGINRYVGYGTDLVTNAPTYVPYLGQAYTLQIPEAGTERGWNCTTNQNVPWLVIAPANRWVPRSTTAYTLLAGTSGNMVGMLAWHNANNDERGAIAAVASWSVAAVPLGLGNNLITVSGTNASGDAASASVTVMRDLTLPMVTVAPFEIWVENHIADLALNGVPSNVAEAIAWQNTATGAGGTVPSTTPFIIPAISVNVGTNYIVVSATNMYGDSSVQTVVVYRTGVPTNYYVNLMGSDVTGSGSLGNPWLTINKAIGTAPNGTFMQPTLINVAAGTYTNETTGGNWVMTIASKQYFIIAGAGPTNTLLRKGALILSLPVVRIDNSRFTALRGMNLDMSAETVAWSDNNSALRMQTYEHVVLEDLWLKGPVTTAQRNGHGLQLVSATTTRNVTARRVLVDGFGRGVYVQNNSATAPATMLIDQCTLVNQNGSNPPDDSRAIWTRANASGNGKDSIAVKNCVVANVQRGLCSDNEVGNVNSIGVKLFVQSYGNAYSNVLNGLYNGVGIQNSGAALNDLQIAPLFTTLPDTRPYVATGVYGKGWVTYSENTLAPRAIGAGTNVPPGGSVYILTNAPATFTGTKPLMSYLLLNSSMQNAGWTDTTWSVTMPLPPAGMVATNRLAFIGSPMSPETLIIMQQIPEPLVGGLLLLGVALLRCHRDLYM